MDSSRPIEISLSPEQRRFVERLIASGRFPSVEEVLLEGLRGLEEQEAFIDANRGELRQMIEEGAVAEERGEFVDGEAAMEEWRREDEAACARRGAAS